MAPLLFLCRNAFYNVFPAHPFDVDSFVSAGLAFDDRNDGLFYSQRPAEEIGKLLVGFSSHRRRGDLYLEHAIVKTRYLVTAGIGSNPYQQPVTATATVIVQIYFDFSVILQAC